MWQITVFSCALVKDVCHMSACAETFAVIPCFALKLPL